MKRYRYIGTRADHLEDGRPIAPGDVVSTSPEDPLNDRALLVPIPTKQDRQEGRDDK